MNWVRERFKSFGSRIISTGHCGTCTYADFLQKTDDWHVALSQWGIEQGDRVGLVSDFHIEVVALLQALMDKGCIVVPQSEDDSSDFEERKIVSRSTRKLQM